MMSDNFEAYAAWDPTIRWFHWINFVCVVTLMAIGTTILNAGALGVSDAGKVLLKTWHVSVGYVFLLNLTWRIVWGFIGPQSVRWRAVLPGGRGYGGALGRYAGALAAGRAEPYVGHNPLGRIAVAVLLLVLLVQGLSGLVLAGTDIFYPPFGGAVAEWIAADGVDPADVVPYRPDLVNPAAYDAMRALRAPFIETHELGFFVLLALVAVHVAAVVFTELRGGGTVTSAMFTGRKVIRGRPLDADATERRS